MADDPVLVAWPRVYNLIGQLTTEWATLEAALFREFRILVSGHPADDSETAYVLVNGLRWADMLTGFKRLLIAKGLTKAASVLAEISAEAGRVKKIRDIAAHNPFSMLGDEAEVIVFHLSGLKSTKSARYAYYHYLDIWDCIAYMPKLTLRVHTQLQAAIRERPLMPSHEMMQSLLEKPSLPQPPAEDSRRSSPELALQRSSSPQ